jgi:hypothetical protein
MSYTLEKLRTARQAIRQRDWQTAVGMIDALIERYENLAKLQKHPDRAVRELGQTAKTLSGEKRWWKK